MSYTIRFADPQPAGSPITDTQRMRIIVRGASKESGGNAVIMDRRQQPVYTEAGVAARAGIDFTVDGITVSRQPVTLQPEQLTKASYSTKEELARLVERGYIVVTDSTGPTNLTAAAIRAL